jgi:hypothetical protein
MMTAAESRQTDKPDTVILTPEEKRRQRTRSIAIALVLVALVVIFYLVTIVRLGGNVLNRAL